MCVLCSYYAFPYSLLRASNAQFGGVFANDLHMTFSDSSYEVNSVRVPHRSFVSSCAVAECQPGNGLHTVALVHRHATPDARLHQYFPEYAMHPLFPDSFVLVDD